MKKKKLKWQQWIAMVFFVLIGAACGVLMAMLAETPIAEDAAAWQRILSLLFMLITHDRQIASYAKRLITIQDGRIISDEQI